jgi:hypothetical protein
VPPAVNTPRNPDAHQFQSSARFCLTLLQQPDRPVARVAAPVALSRRKTQSKGITGLPIGGEAMGFSPQTLKQHKGRNVGWIHCSLNSTDFYYAYVVFIIIITRFITGLTASLLLLLL